MEKVLTDIHVISVGALIVNQNGLILAFARNSDTKKIGQVGGSRDPGESIREALHREILEETMLDLEIPEEPFFYRPYEGTTNLHAVFLIHITTEQTKFKEVAKDSTGYVEGFALWVTPNEFVDPKRSAFPSNNLLLLQKAGIV